MESVKELEEFMCRPSSGLMEDIQKLEGDIMVLGAGGKMGPTLCKLAQNAMLDTGRGNRVIAVSRFSDDSAAVDLEEHGITVIKADLLDESSLAGLPDVENIIFMAGRKFGTEEDQSLTWVMNAYLPGRVAERFKNSRIVVFSTGNVYPFVDVASSGSTEDSPVGPVGIYANSCLGRENVFRYFSKKNGTPVLLFRLNYAIDMRYGVLLEIARSVYEGRPVDVSTGYFNAVWQGYANEAAIRSLFLAKTPPETLNVTGPEKVSTRETALKFAKLFGKTVEITGIEKDTALLSDSSKCMDLFGEPSVKIDDMVEMVAGWVSKGNPTIDKPTHFQERKGKF